MPNEVTAAQIAEQGLEEPAAAQLADQINSRLRTRPAVECWQAISKEVLRPDHPFELHRFLYGTVYSDWDPAQGPPPAWAPTEEGVRTANITSLMAEQGCKTYQEFHRWTVENREAFWKLAIGRLGIRFMEAPERYLDPGSDVESPRWLPGAKLNIVDSCFGAPRDSTAIVYRTKSGELSCVSCGELEALTNRVANGLVDLGLKPGDAIGICMPMTVESVAIYLGIIRAGCAVVGIADSFAPDSIRMRLTLGKTEAVFTQDFDIRGRKPRPLYEKVCQADAPATIVAPSGHPTPCQLRDGDIWWDAFLGDRDEFDSVPASPEAHTNILFSSGTTGEPKAIPWTQTTPIRCAADAYLHQNIQPGDVLAWPTNLGWMMGPWLIYASLVNRASMALHYGAPTGKDFCEFVQDAKVTMLGVVPSMVKAWRNGRCVEGIDWQTVKVFSSTGECSNAEDMLYLMSRAGYKPIIEYCGGTEIGGGYITGTVVQPAAPSTFSTPALGLDLVILDERGNESDSGELFLIPPSIGLSNQLLNRDHHEVYFAGLPAGPGGATLRRHGDQMERLPGGYYRAHGRADDTMNLGGIKVSSAEIERVLNSVTGILETAAISVSPPGGGPESLVVYAVLEPETQLEKDRLKASMQEALKGQLNPLFSVHDVELVDALPRTASNKVMRRKLRDAYGG